MSLYTLLHLLIHAWPQIVSVASQIGIVAGAVSALIALWRNIAGLRIHQGGLFIREITTPS